jgi:hypothetical protein
VVSAIFLTALFAPRKNGNKKSGGKEKDKLSGLLQNELQNE